MAITPVVSYLFTGLVGCSVNPRISHGVHKLIRTLRVIKKKKKQRPLDYCKMLLDLKKRMKYMLNS